MCFRSFFEIIYEEDYDATITIIILTIIIITIRR